ncbi:hypothetical protein N1028_10515 [Herbiconiux sp. CPCC 203407]|uniref:TOMM leader peptide-binding protein n=1 Tax=Herbiconiux oxytropis TaxID=2970915 RepID=A0AA41XDQ9_9MICO|nr:hypothetical protein [Herbiconiux oxytropis]MCS5721237.1 hypothetical protein [Herbiconiux oxytropis]MCS5726324.1 hypothetical protein [Herbiconiux oxytropis]
MALRLNPDHPLVWRTPSALQFGVEEPLLRLETVDDAQETVLGLTAGGVSRPVLGALTSARRIGAGRVDEILGELHPVLGEPLPLDPLRGRRMALDGHGAAAAAVARLLEQLGASVRPLPGPLEEPPVVDPVAQPGSSLELAVVLSHFATVPRRAARWLRADVPHLLVEFGDRSIRVGPVVVPGRGPCAMCLELWRVDRDPAWPAIAIQAARRTAPSADPLGIASAAAIVARVVVEHLGSAGWADRALRVRRPGIPAAELPGAADAVIGCGISVERVSPHPRCGCRSP